jgi:hypothetical protein
VAVLAVGEQHSGDERAERHRKAERVEQRCGCDDHQQRRGREGLVHPGVRDDSERRAKQMAPETDYQRHHQCAQQQRLPVEL